MKYCILYHQNKLRGWIGLPYALVHDGDVIPLRREEFNALLVCDGQTDIEAGHLQKVQSTLQALVEKGFIYFTDEPKEMDREQYYHHFDNRYIRDFYWSITGRCNYKCRHCYINAPDAALGEMTHEEAINTIDQIADCGVYHLLISGGEPMVRQDFWSLIDYALLKEIQIDQIYTNGSLLTDNILDGFERRGIKPEFSISFDGVGWHDWMRRVRGAEQKALDALMRCKDRGFSTNVEMCVHRGNAEAIRDSVNALVKTGTRSIKFSEVSGSSLWRQNASGYDMTTREYVEAVIRYLPAYFEDGMPIDILFGGVVKLFKQSEEYRLIAEFDKGTDTCLNRHICGAVRSTCYIGPDGRLLPCMPIACVPEQSLFPRIQDIGLNAALKDSFLMEFVDRRVKDLLEYCKTCRECPYHLRCGGGCRATAVIAGERNLMGPDPNRCLMWKEGYREKVHEACDTAISKYCHKRQ